MTGKLYLIPSFLGNTTSSEVFPELNSKIVASLKHFIVEDERTARRFIKKIVPEAIIDQLNFMILNEHTAEQDTIHYLDVCNEYSVGLVSEAGVPCIADPGSIVVKQAHVRNIEVVPLIGPSSIILALMASGMNGQNFAFNGYLPIEKNERSKSLKNLEKRSLQEKQTQLFIETPYRNVQLFEEILKNCNENTHLCIACDITLPEQYIKTFSIKEWKNKKPDIHKRPAIFIISNS